MTEAVTAIQDGRPVIVVDDTKKENEGGFVCAAESITPDTVDFLLRHGRGSLGVAVGREIAERFGISSRVDWSAQVSSPAKPSFLAVWDHRESGTGVSNANRARTVQAIAAEESRPQDFVQPGHVPLMGAAEGGVLLRPGLTEASVDLMRLANRRAAGASIEILSRQGFGMADLAELKSLAEEFDIPLITIEELIRYRRTREQLVSRDVQTTVPTRYGTVTVMAYSVRYESDSPLALLFGDVQSVAAPIVRIHSSLFGADLLASLRQDGRSPFHVAMETVSRESPGVIVYVGHEVRDARLRAAALSTASSGAFAETMTPQDDTAGDGEVHSHMIALQILRDLGITRVRLLTDAHNSLETFPWSAMGIEVIEQVPLPVASDV